MFIDIVDSEIVVLENMKMFQFRQEISEAHSHLLHRHHLIRNELQVLSKTDPM